MWIKRVVVTVNTSTILYHTIREFRRRRPLVQCCMVFLFVVVFRCCLYISNSLFLCEYVIDAETRYRTETYHAANRFFSFHYLFKALYLRNNFVDAYEPRSVCCRRHRHRHSVCILLHLCRQT